MNKNRIFVFALAAMTMLAFAAEAWGGHMRAGLH